MVHGHAMAAEAAELGLFSTPNHGQTGYALEFLAGTSGSRKIYDVPFHLKKWHVHQPRSFCGVGLHTSHF